MCDWDCVYVCMYGLYMGIVFMGYVCMVCIWGMYVCSVCDD